MSKEKVSAQDIVGSIALTAGVTKDLADGFLRALTEVVEEALQAGETVDIKGFGRFKLTWIAPRRSVHVQTGEEVLIEGHHRVVFVPEKELKELVNSPFAHLEPVVLGGQAEAADGEAAEPAPLAVLAEQADEIKGLLSEIRAMSAATDGDRAEELPVAQPSCVAPELRQADPRTTDEVARDEAEAAPFADASEVLPGEVKSRRVLPGLLLAVVLLFGGVTAAYFLCMPVQHWMNRTLFGYDTAAYDAPQSLSPEEACGEVLPAEPELSQPAPADSLQLAFDRRLDRVEYLATERLNSGSRLAYLAERYYGSPYFWVYIYEANMDRIPDPNRVQEGTVVRIPRIDPLLLDPDSPRAMEKALELREKYLQ